MPTTSFKMGKLNVLVNCRVPEISSNSRRDTVLRNSLEYFFEERSNGNLEIERNIMDNCKIFCLRSLCFLG